MFCLVHLVAELLLGVNMRRCAYAAMLVLSDRIRKGENRTILEQSLFLASHAIYISYVIDIL